MDVRTQRLALIAMSVVLALSAAVAALVLGTSREPRVRDPRAFAVDDGMIPFAEVLSRTGITIPECLDQRLRYAFVLEGRYFSYRKVYLEFVTDDGCLDQFLTHNSDQNSRRRQEVPEDRRQYSWPPATAQEWVLREIGWELDPSQPLEAFGFVTEEFFGIQGVVQPQPGTGLWVVYIYGWRLP